MKIIEVKEKVNSILLVNNTLCYTRKNEIFINNSFFSKKDDDYLFVTNNQLFMVSKNEKESYLYLYLENEKKFKLLSTEFTTVFFNNFNNFIYYKINDDFPVITFFKTNISEFSLDGLNSILSFDSSKILVYDSLFRKQILKTNIDGIISQVFKINDGFIIYLTPKVIENILYFTAYDNDQRNQLVTGLNIENGDVIWQNQYEVTSANKFISAAAFNEKDQLYYGFGTIFQIFNPKTGEIVFEKTFEESKKNNLSPDVNAVYDNKLWFVSGKFETVKFGYINLETKEIELFQDFPQENDEVFDLPIFHEGKLYLRGKHYNNLYVFEV